ncbi:hypothetical protein LshimejAT787_2100410 [Lyophyllum shimeji]|uniref:Fungal calcium binding protein domain-containing protein n=1 Tax=Lyophyllum shimeji TaxID=47721 RepID=A0A9P3UWN2_LYOSH|nr:hypothetical protein LshimejAT787_2100410 [Lyophyllum shimeji]
MRFTLSFALGLVAMIHAAVALPASRILFTRGNCKVGGCLAALGPAAVSCVGAAVKVGVDTIADASCVANVINQSVHVPPDCQPCLQHLNLKSKIKTAVEKVEHKLHN